MTTTRRRLGHGPTVVADHRADWTCDTGASLIIEATGPGAGALPSMHGALYVCPQHQDDAHARITSAGYTPDPREAPPSHRWDPWPCGHITTYDAPAAAELGTPAPAPE